ncbi:scavenger receptor class F member 1-like [Crassostrea angulata]|uniref:multiple epidermal growth factor-like domains protein 10 n=1 Tax=Magallana gigas TaxID=29159 RepID=UPI0022B0B5CA|nr:scavenger receptor class F member 1-like [Crassostrea angulata]
MCPDFNIHNSFLLYFVCVLLYIQLSEQNPVRPDTNAKQCKTWNETLHKCQECNLGFVGNNCEISCRYPGYGNNCQSECNCHKNYCNPATGCKSGSPTLSSPKRLMTSVETSSVEFSTANKIECPAGYFGKGCNIPCRYPNYGYLCQLKCNCNKERCNIAKGCAECSEGYNRSGCEKHCQYPAFGGRCQRKCNCSKEYCDPLMGCNVSIPPCASDERTQTEALIYITIVLGVWAAVQCVIYFCLSCGLVSCDFNTKYNVFE